jgi:hypothetical protein
VAKLGFVFSRPSETFVTLCQILQRINLWQGALGRGRSTWITNKTPVGVGSLEIDLTLELRCLAATCSVKTLPVSRRLAGIQCPSARCILRSHQDLIDQIVLLLSRLLHLLVCCSQWTLADLPNKVRGHIVLARTRIRWIHSRNSPNSLRIGY